MNTLRKLLLVLLVGALAVLPVLATRSSYDYDPEFDFSTLKSFAWKPRAKTTRIERINPLVDKRVRLALEERLVEEGFTKGVKPEDADFLLVYHVSAREKLSVHHFGYGAPYWWGRHATVSSWTEGTLILDIFSAKSGELIWRGWVSQTVSRSSSPEKADRRIRRAVKKLLRDFPPEE